MKRPILLDTCALIWLANRDPLRGSAEEELAGVENQLGGIVVSPISAWEIGQLAARGRVALSSDPAIWFSAALGAGLVMAAMTPEILIASSYLPSKHLRDPADRIIAATARALDYRLMTRDGPLLEFGEAGHARTIPC